MKRILTYFLFISCSFSGLAQTKVYHPFPKLYAAWSEDDYVNTVSSTTNYYYDYYLSGDTVVNGNTYTKVRKADSASDVYYTAIREDGSKHIFICCGAGVGSHDSLLYDFNPVPIGNYTAPGYLFPSGGAQVRSIDSVLVGTTYRTETQVLYKGCLDNIIEGIGSTSGLFEWAYSFNWGNRLECFQQNGTTLFSQGACNFFKIDTTVGIPSISSLNPHIQLFPNPATRNFTLTSLSLSKKEKDVRVYSAIGQLVYECKVPAEVDQYNVNISQLVSGFYFVEISNTDGTVVKKLTVVR